MSASRIISDIFERDKYRPIIISISIVIISLIFIWRNHTNLGGVFNGFSTTHAQMGGDSPIFTSGASALLDGEPLNGKQSMYSGYIIAMAFIRYLGFAYDWIVAVQLSFTIIAAFAIYNLGKELGGYLSGIFASFLLVENPDLAIWNGYILTDALYTNCVVISVFCLFKANQRKGMWRPISFIMILSTALIRPTGWALLLTLVIYLVYRYISSLRGRLVVSAIALFLFLGLVSQIPSVEKESTVVQNLMKGTIIWGYDDWRLDMPVENGIEGASLNSGIRYVVSHPAMSLKLAVYHVGVELARVRPYYPARMNVRIAVGVAMLYVLAVAGLINSYKNPLAPLLCLVIAGHIALIAVTFATYNARFSLHFLPLIMVFSGHAIAYIFHWMAHIKRPDMQS